MIQNSKIFLYAIVVLIAIGLLAQPLAFADVSSPRKQMKLGIAEKDIFCKQGYFKVIRVSSETPACLKLGTVMKLVNNGWAKPVDIKLLDAEKRITSQSIGQINILTKSKLPGTAPIERTTPLTIGYNVVFEVCSNEKTIRAAAVLISSDSEVQQVKLPLDILANSCNISAVKIKASDVDSITGELVNKGRLSAKLVKMEENVADLRQKLKTERTNLALLVNKSPLPEDFDKQKDTIINNIVKLRKEFNTSSQELNRYLFALNVNTSTKATSVAIPKTFSGVPIEGVFANKLSISESLSENGTFDVVFEVCAGKDMIRVPILVLHSDIENKALRLADKISPNSCQVSGTKINATNPESITVDIGNTVQRSAMVVDLEKKIIEFETSIKSEKESLRNLTHMAPRPADFNEKVDILVNKVVDLRKQIHENRAKLYLILNQPNE